MTTYKLDRATLSFGDQAIDAREVTYSHGAEMSEFDQSGYYFGFVKVGRHVRTTPPARYGSIREAIKAMGHLRPMGPFPSQEMADEALDEAINGPRVIVVRRPSPEERTILEWCFHVGALLPGDEIVGDTMAAETTRKTLRDQNEADLELYLVPDMIEKGWLSQGSCGTVWLTGKGEAALMWWRS